MNEVLNGLSNPSSITLGYIPTGSGNDFARGMQIPTDPRNALSIILNPKHIQQMDIGILKSADVKSRFGVSTGIGFDATICHEALASPIKDLLNRMKLGKLTYAGIALKQILLYRPCRAVIRLDQKQKLVFHKMYFITVMNQPYEGGGFKFCPDANSHDGKLHLCIVGSLNKPKIVFLFPFAFSGNHTRIKGIHILTCTRLDIHTERLLPVHSDGEYRGYAKDISIFLEKKPIGIITS